MLFAKIIERLVDFGYLKILIRRIAFVLVGRNFHLVDWLNLTLERRLKLFYIIRKFVLELMLHQISRNKI